MVVLRTALIVGMSRVLIATASVVATVIPSVAIAVTAGLGGGGAFGKRGLGDRLSLCLFGGDFGTATFRTGAVVALLSIAPIIPLRTVIVLFSSRLLLLLGARLLILRPLLALSLPTRGRLLHLTLAGGLLLLDLGLIGFVIILIVLVIEEILELIEGRADVGEVEEGILGLADIDECGVHPLHDALDASKVDGAYVAFLIGNFEKDFGEAVIFSDGNAYLRGGSVDDNLFFHAVLDRSVDQSGGGKVRRGATRQRALADGSSASIRRCGREERTFLSSGLD